MDYKTIIISLVISVILIRAVKNEMDTLGCKRKITDIRTFTDNSQCENENNQYSLMIRNNNSNNPFEVFERVVIWRRSFILSLIIISVYQITLNTFDIIKYSSGVIISTFFIYFNFNYYRYHQDSYIYGEILKKYDISLKKQSNL